MDMDMVKDPVGRDNRIVSLDTECADPSGLEGIPGDGIVDEVEWQVTPGKGFVHEKLTSGMAILDK